METIMKIRNVLPILFLSYSLFGCASVDSSPRIVEVPVAAAAGVEPPVIPRPELALDRIKTDTSSGEVLQLYRESVEQLISYAESIEKALDAYRTDQGQKR
jgi:hypothetical protein